MLGRALEVVTRAIGSYLVKNAGFTHKRAKTGAVTLIQRFGSALNPNIHFHMLFLDGVYEVDFEGTTAKFHAIETPTSVEMNRLLHRDITVCRHCFGPVRIIACIEDRQVINKILAHINQQQKSLGRSVVVGAGIRAPPTESKALMNQ